MKKIILATVITLVALVSPLSNAASVSFTPNVTSGNITATVNKGTLNFSFSGDSVVNQIFVLDQGDVNPQSPSHIGDVIEATFGLAAGTLITGNSGDISGSSATITSSTAFDYLAIHFGGYEALFQFATLMPANSVFSISDVSATKGGGLSNYRVYDSGLSAVPVPAALFLFAPALLGFMGLRRKAKNLVV